MTDPGVHSQHGQALSESSSGQAFYRSWLATLVAQIGSVTQGVVVRVDGAELGAVVCGWPEGQSAAALEPRVARLAHEASVDREGRFEPFAGPDGAAWWLAYPVLLSGEVAAVVLLQLASAQQTDLHHAMNAMRWGCGWVEAGLWRERFEARVDDRSAQVLTLLAQGLDRQGVEAAVMALVQEMARLSRAERVSLAIGDGRDLRVRAISDVTEFNSRMNEIRHLEAAMREVLQAGVGCTASAAQDLQAWPAHAALLGATGNARTDTFALQVADRPVGAVTFEYRVDPQQQGWPPAAWQGALALVAQVLQLQVEAHATVLQRARAAGRRQLQAFWGPAAYRRKTLAVAAVLLLAVLSMAQGEYHLSVDAQIDPKFQRVLTVPYNGYLASAAVRPGDEVRQGQVLARLDDREQHLERVRWVTEVEKLRKKTSQAVAAHDRASVGVLAAQLAQAEAQLDLIESQLSRVEVAAPFDGLIVSGDPTQRLGDVLRKGEVLYQMAPLNAYRVLLRVPENRMADLQQGMTGSMQLTSMPDLGLRLTIDRIHPFTQRRDGASFFPVEARIEGQLDQVRPGMEGVARIHVDRRNLFGIWVRSLGDRLRQAWWSLPG